MKILQKLSLLFVVILTSQVLFTWNSHAVELIPYNYFNSASFSITDNQATPNLPIIYNQINEADYLLLRTKCNISSASGSFGLSPCKPGFNHWKELHPLHDIKSALTIYVEDLGYIYSSPLRFNRKGMFILGGVTATALAIHTVDQEIYDAAHRSWDNKVYKPIRILGDRMEVVCLQAVNTKYYAGALGLGYLSGCDLLRNIALDVFESFYIVYPLMMATEHFGRRRPKDGKGPYSVKLDDGTSFFSGHTSTMMQQVVIWTHHIDYLQFTLGAYGVAAAACAQRINSTSHWPSDVFVGAVIGYIVARQVTTRNDTRRYSISPTIMDQNRPGLSVSFSL
ncbi:MAG: phosphatase PAP2 family protein [Candidatus Electryonea clarkiae]|nr:phosphatase PAP2 family protein [Candidatus Electryonea clarkiae]MDP8286000.1 phosphatase PAP2 family protein [Candidatus Electryonea clarkiae]